MDFISFPEANRALGAPKDMTPEEVGTLPVYADGQQCISCWQPTEAEREAIAAGHPVYLGVLVSSNPAKPVFTQAPVYVTVGKPNMPPVVHELTAEIEDALKQFADRLPEPEAAWSRPMKGWELRSIRPEVLATNGEALKLSTLYFISSLEVQAQHLADMREAYKQHGQPGVVAYLKPYVHFLNTPAEAAQ